MIMKKNVGNIICIVILVLLTGIIFRKTIFSSKIPFPSNLQMAFFAPWVSYPSKEYPSGPPAKPLGFDNIKIYYPVRSLITEIVKSGQFPLWNPYTFSGTMLHGTFQAGVFHPASFLFYILPQIGAWTVIIILQPILTGLFTFLYLRGRNLSVRSSIFGALGYAFSGIMVVWWEEMFIGVYSILFLPLILFAIDRMRSKVTSWRYLLLVVASLASLFSGWFQGTFYVWAFAGFYIVALFLSDKKKDIKKTLLIVLGLLNAIVIGSIQLFPGIESYFESVRRVSDVKGMFDEYLVSLTHLVTFVAPDYFGNPAVHNYYGKGFYHEQVLYVGIPIFLFALYEIYHFRNNSIHNTFFKISSLVVLSLGFALPTTWVFLYYLKLPFLSEMNPSRIFFISSFGFSVLGAYGIERFFNTKIHIKPVLFAVLPGAVLLLFGWLFVLLDPPERPDRAAMIIRNMLLPSAIFVGCVFLFMTAFLEKFKKLTYFGFVVVAIGSVLYFTNKYLYFSERNLVFTNVGVLEQLQKISGIDRFWSVGDGHFLSNIGIYYRLFSPEGYDSFNIGRYNELVYSSHTNGILSYEMPRADVLIYQAKNIEEVAQNHYRLRMLSLTGTKYIAAKSEEVNVEGLPFKKIWSDSKYDIFEYKNVIPRIFITDTYVVESGQQKILNYLYSSDFDLSILVLEEKPDINITNSKNMWSVQNVKYDSAKISMKVKTDKDSLLFLSDAYYPGWKAYVDGKDTKIYRADYTFRSIVVPKGEHEVVFSYEPKSFVYGIIGSGIGILVLATVWILGIYKKKISG